MNSPRPLNARLAALATGRAWWMVVAWVLFAGVLNLAVPSLESVVAKSSTPPLPAEASSMQAFKTMNKAFGTGRSSDFVMVVVERRDAALTAADLTWVKQLSTTLAADTENVAYVPDIAHEPELLKASTSKDRHALYLQVGIPAETGTPASLAQVQTVRDTVAAHTPSGLSAYVTGTPATITDVSTEVEHSVRNITIATVLLIALLLLLIYRSWATTALIVFVIGICLGVTRGVAAWLGLHVLDLSSIAGSFMTAVVLGASTDYTIFLVSRYHEYRRLGWEPSEAAREAATKVSSVVIGSALTVVVAIGTMGFAKLGAYATTGPVVAIAVAVTLLICLTLTPAVLRLAGNRGLIAPKPPRADGAWARMGELVATRPREVLLAGLVPLILLAAFFPFLKPGYDPRGTLPDSTPSNQGFDAIARHFPVNAILPDWIVVTAPHDMREVESLAALEQIARQVSRVPGIASVSGITRPLGDPLTEATLAYQAGIVGDQLKKAAGEAGASNPSELTDGLTQLGDASSQISNGADVAHSGSKQLAQGADKLVDGLTQLSHATSQAQGGSTQLRDGARALANGLEDAAQQSQQLLSALQLVHSGLTKSLGCSLDPVCNQSRTGLQQIVTLVESELIPGMRQAAQGARQLADGTTTLASGLTQIDDGMKQARAGAAKLADGQTQLADGLGKLSGATGQLAQGASQAGSQIGAETTKSLDGLSKAAKALIELGKAKDGPGAGFYLPPSVLKSPEFATVSQLFMSPDGRTARFAVLGEANAFSQEAMDRSHDVLAAAQSAVKATALASAQIQATGIPPINADLQKYSSRDFSLLAITSLLAVLFILIVLLRSLVGPILLLLSVVLSYAAAVGLATLAWQMILGSSVDSVVPVAAFILLVAVGSDYNMLLMMRILEESPDGSREGVGRALRMTGGVITAAGIIFAGSMLAMMAGTVSMLRQMGFTVGIGLLLDTFVVRSMVVPALASLLRSGIWWPRLRRRA